MSKMKWKAEQTRNPLWLQEELWNASLDVFSMQAYGEASLNEIIRKAGMNKGSFYYRFYDKLDLYLSLLTRMADEKLTMVSQGQMRATGKDFFEDFRQIAMLSLRFAQQEPRYMGLWRRFMSEDHEIKRMVHEEFGPMSQDAIGAMVEMAKAQGKIRPNSSTVLVSHMISALLNSIDQMIVPNGSEEEMMAQIDKLIEMLKHGIR